MTRCRISPFISIPIFPSLSFSLSLFLSPGSLASNYPCVVVVAVVAVVVSRQHATVNESGADPIIIRFDGVIGAFLTRHSFWMLAGIAAGSQQPAPVPSNDPDGATSPPAQGVHE